MTYNNTHLAIDIFQSVIAENTFPLVESLTGYIYFIAITVSHKIGKLLD